MIVEKLSFESVRYNPELSAFEALVHITEDGENYAYPVHMLAPLHAEIEVIKRGLTEKAVSAHRHAPNRETRLHRKPVPCDLHTVPYAADQHTPDLRRLGAALAA